MLARARQTGVTLIELMIGMAITVMVLVWGLPSFTLWLQSSQNRTAAESIQNGLQLARSEAVSRNTVVRFNLTNATGLVAWSVGCATVTPDCPATIQSRSSAEGGANARIGASTAAIPSPPPAGHFATALAVGAALPAGVSFDALGRVPAANIGTDITRVDVTNAATANARRMVVTINPGGHIRMCDPGIALSTSPQGCS